MQKIISALSAEFAHQRIFRKSGTAAHESRSLKLIAVKIVVTGGLLISSSALKADVVGAVVTGTKGEALELTALAPVKGQGLILAIGDRVKIMFLERVGKKDADAAAQMQNVVERTELTGDYTVQADSNITIPVLGSEEIGGESLSEAQDKLQSAYKKVFGKDARVSIAIREREPVYVLGRVSKPGTYEYSPGMTVLHALALAGGLENARNSEYFEAVRESQRLEQSLERQKKLIARIDVMKAEREEATAQPSEGLVKLAGDEIANALVAEVQNLRRWTIESRQARLAALDSAIEASTKEMQFQGQRIARIRTSADNKSERMELLKAMLSRGNTSGFHVLQAKSEYSEAEERINEALGVSTQIADRLTQAQFEKSKIVNDGRVELERELAATEDQLTEEVSAAAASAKILQLTKATARPVRPQYETQSYVVVRRTTAGVVRLPASDTFELLPGDLIMLKDPADGAPLGDGPQSEMKMPHPSAPAPAPQSMDTGARGSLGLTGG